MTFVCAEGAMNNDVAAAGRFLSTPELLRAVPVSRSIFFRLREQNPVLKPARTVGTVHLWPEALVETVRSILSMERDNGGVR